MREREPLKHFLLVFDHLAGQLHSCTEFDDVEAALEAYEAAEGRYDIADRMEVVLIGSDSIETVRETHANYFDGTAALARALVDILEAAQSRA